MLNVEQRISNDEVKSFLLLPSAFVIRYSTCPLRPQWGFGCSRLSYKCQDERFSAKHPAGQAGILRFALEFRRVGHSADPKGPNASAKPCRRGKDSTTASRKDHTTRGNRDKDREPAARYSCPARGRSLWQQREDRSTGSHQEA
jgi:hypothetical protein